MDERAWVHLRHDLARCGRDARRVDDRICQYRDGRVRFMAVASSAERRAPRPESTPRAIPAKKRPSPAWCSCSGGVQSIAVDVDAAVESRSIKDSTVLRVTCCNTAWVRDTPRSAMMGISHSVSRPRNSCFFTRCLHGSHRRSAALRREFLGAATGYDTGHAEAEWVVGSATF